jgi:hypothetical protein
MKRKPEMKRVLSILMLLCATCAQAQTASVTVTWVNPTTNTDGTALSPSSITSASIIERNVTLGIIVGSAPVVVPSAGGVPPTSVTFTGLAPAAYSYQVAVTESDGQTSAYSPAIQVVIPVPPPEVPSAPGAVTAVMN